LATNIYLKGGRVWLVWDLCIPTFIPSQVAYLYSSIVRYERNSMQPGASSLSGAMQMEFRITIFDLPH